MHPRLPSACFVSCCKHSVAQNSVEKIPLRPLQICVLAFLQPDQLTSCFAVQECYEIPDKIDRERRPQTLSKEDRKNIMCEELWESLRVPFTILRIFVLIYGLLMFVLIVVMLLCIRSG